jgi:UPF0755 protein
MLFVLLCLGAIGGVWGFFWWAGHGRSVTENANPARIEIKRGDSLRNTALQLERAGVAGPADAVVVLARIERRDRTIKPGVYLIPSGMTPRDVLRRLTKGPDTPTTEVSIPEGWTAEQIADRLVARGVLLDKKPFLQLCADTGLAQRLHLPEGSTVEGFLFPDTYGFEPNMDSETVIRRMVARFEAVLRELRLRPGINSPDAYPLDLHNSMILASIVEREAGVADEMPRIASVYHNRLRKNMPLGSCATVRYALDKWKSNLTTSDLETDSPYNTYRVHGLPPAPICNPGRAAIEAAFRPEATDYLYYVYRGQRRHEFSRTLQQHERARNKYKELWLSPEGD